MNIIRILKNKIKQLVRPAKVKSPNKSKESSELSYWKGRQNIEGVLNNRHYEYFYTEHFHIQKSSYEGKVLMDLGCGPRGSLEWATNAKRRIGLDPLASKYINELGADKHNMEYISSGSESIPLKDGECDYIFSFNSLDHVENIDDTVKEIKRCLASDGVFLILVEINHPSTICEPHNLSPNDILNSFAPEFEAEYFAVYKPEGQGIYHDIKLNNKVEFPKDFVELGWLSAKFIRK